MKLQTFTEVKKKLGAIEKKSAEIRPFEVGGWADPLISLGILLNP